MMLLYSITIVTTLQSGQTVKTEQFVGLMTQEQCERVARRIEEAQAPDFAVATCHVSR